MLPSAVGVPDSRRVDAAKLIPAGSVQAGATSEVLQSV